MSDIVWLLPPERCVFEILETVTFDDALFARCHELRRAGFRIALDDVSQVAPRLAEFLSCVDIVKIDLVECRARTLPKWSALSGSTGRYC